VLLQLRERDVTKRANLRQNYSQDSNALFALRARALYSPEASSCRTMVLQITNWRSGGSLTNSYWSERQSSKSACDARPKQDTN